MFKKTAVTTTTTKDSLICMYYIAERIMYKKQKKLHFLKAFISCTFCREKTNILSILVSSTEALDPRRAQSSDGQTLLAKND